MPGHTAGIRQYVTPVIISLVSITGLASSNGLLTFGSLPRGNHFTAGKGPLLGANPKVTRRKIKTMSRMVMTRARRITGGTITEMMWSWVRKWTSY